MSIRWPRLSSFRAQIAIVSLASLATVVLAAVLVRDVLVRTEGRLLQEARQQCSAAARELKAQYLERADYADEPILQLPIEAQDLSLRGLSGAVLRSYDGVEGGFWLAGSEQTLGYAFPRGDSRPDFGDQEQALLRSALTSGSVIGTFEFGRDAAILAAESLDGATVAWTRKRLEGVHDPGGARRRWLMAALVLSVVLGMGGIVSIWIFLRGGVSAIHDGLRRLEEDFSFRLPAAPGDFGQIAGWINRMADTRARLEADVRHQDRLAALGTVVAGVAHEIRNPLNSMKLTLELLDRRLQRGAASSDEARTAIAEVDRLNRIVNRLLMFGKPTLEDRRPQALAPVVERASKLVQEQAQLKGVGIRMSAGDDCQADMDAPQIEQVLINLLLNAIDASPAGESVLVTAENSDGWSRVTITNMGPAMPEETKAHLFDAYFTTKPNGTGLGLSVSREIVVNHGGSLEFDSQDGRTSFWMDLPAQGKSAA